MLFYYNFNTQDSKCAVEMALNQTSCLRQCISIATQSLSVWQSEDPELCGPERSYFIW